MEKTTTYNRPDIDELINHNQESIDFRPNLVE